MHTERKSHKQTPLRAVPGQTAEQGMPCGYKNPAAAKHWLIPAVHRGYSAVCRWEITVFCCCRTVRCHKAYWSDKSLTKDIHFCFVEKVNYLFETKINFTSPSISSDIPEKLVYFLDASIIVFSLSSSPSRSPSNALTSF